MKNNIHSVEIGIQIHSPNTTNEQFVVLYD
jgi:hypothetical protein